MTRIRVGSFWGTRARFVALTSFLAVSTLPVGAVSAWAQVVCKPLLSVKAAEELRPSMPALPRAWTATIAANSRHCATGSGVFEIDFVRGKENAPDIQYTEKFRWQHNEFNISMEMSSDEFILSYRIGFIATCVCRSIADLRGPQ